MYMNKILIYTKGIRLLPPPPKPKIDMKILQKTVGVIVGVASLYPPAKLALTAIIAVADAADKGSASNYLNSGNNTNSTLNMLPGEFLVQNVSNLATKGQTGIILAKYTPDPIRIATTDVIKISTTIATNPNNTLSVGKALAYDNLKSLKDPLDDNVNLVKSTLNLILTGHIKES